MGGAIYRREFFDIAFPPGRFEDTVVLMELLRKGEPMLLSPYGSYRYYDRPGSFINAKWDVSKWEGYTNALLATWQTSDVLLPSRAEIVARCKRSHYYKLWYLSLREPRSEGYRDLLKAYTARAGKIDKSCKLLTINLFKAIAYRILNGVTGH